MPRCLVDPGPLALGIFAHHDLLSGRAKNAVEESIRLGVVARRF
jgi:hypothetical protein